jgi:phosphatidylglycerol:prolipoprotein diacylglycerol transferase
MLVHPNIDPVAIKLGPLKVHWYGLMYLLGFWGAWWLGTVRAKWPHVNWPRERVGDLLFYAVLGVILGGRIGYMLFYAYDPQGHWLEAQDPSTIFRIWDGGMSFHGGLMGVIVAMLIFAYHHKLTFWEVADFAAVITPFGLFTGRIGNFINGELWGAPTTLPWGMVFQNAHDNLPHHPSQLYEAGLEGLAMLAILWWVGTRPTPRGTISGLFLVLYAVFRFAIEFVRLPDTQLGYLYGTGWFTMGMQLCVPMFLCGVAFIWMAYHRKPAAQPSS